MRVRSSMFTQSHWKKKIKRTKNLTAKEEPKAKEKCKLMRGSATKNFFYFFPALPDKCETWSVNNWN